MMYFLSLWQYFQPSLKNQLIFPLFLQSYGGYLHLSTSSKSSDGLNPNSNSENGHWWWW